MKFIKTLFPAFLILLFVLSGCNNDQNQNNNDETTQEQNTGETEQDETAEDSGNQAKTESENENISMENKVFKLSNPQPNAQVGQSFTVEGQAQVFEGQFGYRIVDDNNNEIQKDIVQVKEGNADSESLWRNFSFQVELNDTEAITGSLILYTQSQADGSAENELKIPLRFQ